MPDPTDDEIMQDVYDKLSKVFGLRYPKDKIKEKAFLDARAVVQSAILTLRDSACELLERREGPHNFKEERCADCDGPMHLACASYDARGECFKRVHG